MVSHASFTLASLVVLLPPLRGRHALRVSRFFLWLDVTCLPLPRCGLPHGKRRAGAGVRQGEATSLSLCLLRWYCGTVIGAVFVVLCFVLLCFFLPAWSSGMILARGFYVYLNSVGSPPDQLSYPSSTFVTCNTGFGFMRIGRKLLLHFRVACTDTLCSPPLRCI